MPRPSTGKLIVFSGPSGVGKSTLLRQLLARCSGRLRLSISATTRPPRPDERDGIDYHFLSDEEFQRRREAGEFIESCEVFGRGHWYGTPRSEVTPSLAEGESVILEIDVDGARTVLEQYPEAVTIFVRPRSLADLERRLRLRGTETEESIARRLEVARHEMEQADSYRYVVINDTDQIDRTAEEISQILNS
jgi:guanylate kinase